MSSARRTEPKSEAASGSSPTIDFVGTARFVVRRRIGEGSMGAVYLVFDRETGRELALKTLRRVDASGIYRFKREFRSLADMSHPNLVKLHELFNENDEWFFTMDYVEGRFFLEHVLGRSAAGVERTPRATPELELSASGELLESGELQVRGLELLFPTPLQDEQRLRDVLCQIAEGLQCMHAAGKLHRDLKCENVLVTSAGHAVLLDFGIAADRSWQIHKTLDVGVMGTPAYMSPEQAEGRVLDEATDWYSLGVMLYEALTGSVPFEGSYLQIIQQKQHLDPLPPTLVVSGVSPDLNELCVQLLSRDPAARPRGDAVLRALVQRRAASAPPPLPSMHVEAELPFVGRQLQLDLLAQAMRSTDDGRPVLAFVHGDSGMGKTVLVDAFVARVRDEQQAVVLKGACYERESVPFKAFDSLIDALSRYLRRLSPVRSAELLPRDVTALAQLFPVLKRVEVIKEAKRRAQLPSDPQELRRRAFAALKELFSRIADQQPLLLFIDDLQWGDVDSARLIAELTSSRESPALLCICTYRSGEVAGSDCLQALFSHTREDTHADVREIHVAALAPEESYELARELLGQDAWQQARAIGSESQGSPFLLTELVRYVQRSARISADPPPPVSLQHALSQRLDALSEDSRKLLTLVAVAGRPLPEPMLSLAATFDIELQTALAQLRSARLVRGVATRSVRAVDVYHDRIRQAVLARIDATELALWHRRLASTLEASGNMDLEALSEHLLGAGEVARAGLYAKRAAEQAAQALAFDKAARLYAIAAQHDVSDATERRALLEAWGDALVNAGRALRAAEIYFEACEHATPEQSALLQRKAGIELLRSGHFERGLGALRASLEAASIRVPGSFGESLRQARALRNRLRDRGFVFARRSEQELSPEVLERLDLMFSVTLGMLFTEVDRTLPLVVACAIEALEAGEPQRVARGLCLFHAYVDLGLSESLGQRPLGALDVASALCNHSDDAQSRAWVAFARGSDLMRRGEIQPALRQLERAEELFRNRCTGSAAEMRLCRQLMASLLVHSPQIEDLSKCDDWVREAEEHEDHIGAMRLRLLGTTLALMRDEPERAGRSEEAARASLRGAFDLSAFLHLVSTSQIDLYRADKAACRRNFHAFDAFFRSALVSVPLWRGQCHALRALLLLSASEGVEAVAADLRRAEVEIDAAQRVGLPCLQHGVTLLRATLEARRERREQALALLDEILSAQTTWRDAPMVGAYARACKGELIGGNEGAELCSQADVFVRSRGIKNPSQLARLYAPPTH